MEFVNVSKLGISLRGSFVEVLNLFNFKMGLDLPSNIIVFQGFEHLQGWNTKLEPKKL